MLSKLEYLTHVTTEKVIVGLMGSNYKALRFVGYGQYFALDIKRANEPVTTIFDVGANVGQSCLYFL
jgi:hypothetical protein